MATPRVFIIRHGETEWSLNGRHTGTTDIALTHNGERRIRATGAALVGPDRLIVPKQLAHVYVSPRQRAQRTLQLLGIGLGAKCRVQTTAAVAEWDYGAYEGRTSREIAAEREVLGLGGWDIWRDGCPGGESPQDITARLDALIEELRTQFHAPAMSGDQGGPGGARPADVLVVAHGHILRAFACRWIGKNIADNPSLLLEAGGVGTLSYEHGNINEPAILLGGSFVVDVVEKEEDKVKELEEQTA